MCVCGKKKNLWDATKGVLIELFIVMNAYIRERNISNKQSKFVPQGTRKIRTNEAQS